LTAFFDILIGGVFHAAVLFLVAAGLQLVFGVQKIVNLACGSFYALGAYFGISSVNWAIAAGLPPGSFLPVLVASGVLLGVIGPFIEALLRTVYDRDEAFQLLLTFALVLMFQDVLRFFWGANPQQLGNLSMAYGKLAIGAVQVPTYNVLVIFASVLIAAGIGAFLQRTRFGRIRRESRDEPGARRERAPDLCERLHARHHPRDRGRRARRADRRGIARHAGRAGGRGVRRGGDRRARQHARRAGRSTDRRPHASRGDLVLRRA
jgi:hypothetical protein